MDFRNQGIWQKPDGTKFFHDKDCKANDIEKLKLRISNRIDNFRNIVKSDTPTLFAINVLNGGEYIEALHDELKRLCSHKKFGLAILDFRNLVSEAPNGAYMLKLTEPVPNFQGTWNKSGYRNSKLGKCIEENICYFVKNILEKDF